MQRGGGVRGGLWSISFPHSPQPQVLSPSGIQRKQLLLPRPPATEQALESAGPLPPRMAWEVIPSRRPPSPSWDPSYQAHARPPLLGASCGAGASFSGRTLYHPTWPMYDTWGRSPTSGQPSEEQARGDAGLPVMCYQDVFLLDSLMHCGQRVPLYLSKPPQQTKGSLKLLLPPPVMSSSVYPSTSQAFSSTWLTEAEMIALTGLLQMSQGAPGPSSLAAPPTSTSFPDPVSDHPGPRGGQSCSGGTDPSPPDTHCP
ncbi:histone deacetylase complex subunit SAP25 isoform X1 [Nannospalax galili]|uniref:histone deacetylase complex subunit SAP25 isoform X1 n=1 Tax=Nannospalax galili TaxID=1026970 RepID=UPI0004ED65C7|nr:histone deacetylase complex subunit SAP25 isoform X1 [Nannospalax galili]